MVLSLRYESCRLCLPVEHSGPVSSSTTTVAFAHALEVHWKLRRVRSWIEIAGRSGSALFVVPAEVRAFPLFLTI